MDGLRGQLQLTPDRPADGPAAALASDAIAGLLPGRPFSPDELATVHYWNLSVAGHCHDHSVFSTGLAATLAGPIRPNEKAGGGARLVSGAESVARAAGPRLHHCLCGDSSPRPASPLAYSGRNGMDVWAAPVQLAD